MQETITKQVVKYGHSAHIILSKKMIGQTVTVSKGKSDTKKLLTAINNLQARLTYLEEHRTFGQRFVATRQKVYHNKDGSIKGFGKKIPLKQQNDL